MIHHAANKYLHLGIEYEDLFQLACIGFIEGYRRHDPAKGKVSTIIYMYIRKEIMKHYYNNHEVIRVPEYLRSGKRKDLSVLKQILSLDAPINGEESTTLMDLLEDITAKDPADIV
jgi:RNA polymerase sigma factor (sigma-70 family)